MRMTGTRPRSSSSRPPWSPPMTAGAERGAPVLVMTVIRAGGPWFSANVCDPQGGIPRPARRLLLVNTVAIAERSQVSLRGGRFGPHNQHHPQNGDPTLFDSDDLPFLTWFNAGLRVYD